MEIIEFKDRIYPAFQANGNAARFCRSFAEEICKGDVIYDIGYGCDEWKFPGAIGIDAKDENGLHAMNLPEQIADAIHSSHFLEHYNGRFQDVIEYWLTKIKKGGVIFLYLPNCSHQKYWAWGNKKHVHYLTPGLMMEYCRTLENVSKFFVTDGYDLNSSFYCVIEK
jgi:hypothetical protein